MTTCGFCGRKRGGAFSYATFEGAPDGGVPVHVGDCMLNFFKTIDGTMQKPAPTEEHCVQCGEIDNRAGWVSIGMPGLLKVHDVWLHPECEPDYLARIKSV